MGVAVEGKLDADVPGEVLDALRVCSRIVKHLCLY